ncbi:MAG TPA: hypothetical protein VFC24_17560 [Casimicrobiaceae bacterium]|nr:hypothetical protein [Casimicrobiaceae bacterium]
MRSPYRCRDCGNRFWAVSSRTWAVLAGVVLLLAAALASNSILQMVDALGAASDNAERIDTATSLKSE